MSSFQNAGLEQSLPWEPPRAALGPRSLQGLRSGGAAPRLPPAPAVATRWALIFVTRLVAENRLWVKKGFPCEPWCPLTFCLRKFSAVVICAWMTTSLGSETSAGPCGPMLFSHTWSCPAGLTASSPGLLSRANLKSR